MMKIRYSLEIFTFSFLICIVTPVIVDNMTRMDLTSTRLMTRHHYFEEGNLTMMTNTRPLASDRARDQSGFQYFTQNVNNFVQYTSKTWKQRYLEDDTYFNAAQNKADSRPIFLLIGGQMSINVEIIKKGMWVELAKIHNALLFCVEHRYYGLSKPANDLGTRKLRFLTVAQALEDLKKFILHKNEIYPNNKWIIFGESYSGALAAWLKKLLPDLVVGAVASSAVFPKNIFLPEYYERMTRAITSITHSPQCTVYIKGAVVELINLMEDDTNCQHIETAYNVRFERSCSIDEVKSFFFNMLLQIIGLCVKSNCIITLCEEMNNSTIFSQEKKLANAIGKITRGNNVMMDYTSYSEEKLSIEITETRIGRQMSYQKCNEMGNLLSFYSFVQPRYEIKYQNLELSITCKLLFGRTYSKSFITKGINKIIERYGGVDSKFPDTIFVVGALDFWIDTQMPKNNSAGNIVIEIKGSFDGDDMKPSLPTDSQELQNARNEINKYITKFIGNSLDSDGQPVGLPEFKFILQQLDHNNPNIINEWKQRYLEDDTYFNAEQPKAGDKRKLIDNRPVFLLIGGQHPINAAMMKNGLWVELAKIHHALLFCIEHRYYGLSQPTGYVRQTFYQKCTELGNILTFDSDEQPFYDPDDQKFMLRSSCTVMFGEGYNAQSIISGMGMINVNYGGLESSIDFRGTIFTVGSRDLWIDAQMRRINDGDNTVIEIEGSFDSEDMKPTLPTDSDDLKKARLEIDNYVKDFIYGKVSFVRH